MDATPDPMALKTADFVVIALYMCGMAFLGYVAKRLVKSPEDYFAGGKRVPWWMAAVSHHMSGYSAVLFVAHTSRAYEWGLPMMLLIFNTPIAMAIGAFVWAPRWARLKVLTPVQYLERRFNNVVRQVCAWSGIAIKFIDEGIKLYSLSIIVSFCTGWDLRLVIVGCGVVAVAYLAFGGLWATMLTDFVQFFVQYSITIAIVPFVLIMAGGWRGLWAGQMDKYTLFGGSITPGFLVVWLVVVTLSYNGGTWGLAQRFYSIGKAKDARKAALLSGALSLVYPLIVFVPAWGAHAIVGDMANSEHAYVAVVQKVLSAWPAGFMGLFISAMFAATMSMIDSDLNALSAVFTNDIFKRLFRRNATDALVLRVGFMATVAFGALTIACGLLTIRMEGAFKAMVEWYGAILGPVAVPLLFGMLYRRTTWRGALAAWLLGFATFVAVKYGCASCFATGETPFAVYTGAELAVAIGAFFLEGFLFRQTPDEQARVHALFDELEGRTV